MSVGRKIFHCVVDDTALTANIGEIKKWTLQGAITLIVPLYTLERLHVLKKSGSQPGINARAAVRFLDRVTSGKHHISTDKVVLQGPMEQFEDWKEAERYFLPEFKEEVDNVSVKGSATEPPISKNEEDQPTEDVIEDPSDNNNALNEMSQMLLSKLNFKKEPDTVSVVSAGTCSVPPSPASAGSRASPECPSRQLENGDSCNESTEKEAANDDTPTKYVVPVIPNAIKPLLNATLWRLHAESDLPSVTNSCVLVTNDRATQAWAQKFEITVKSIPQLRTSIIYEDKEFKNHCKYLEKTQNQTQNVDPKPLLSYEDESDEDVLVFVPRKQGKTGAQGATARAPTKATSPRAPVSNGATSSNGGRPRAISTTPEPTREVPSAPIDPDSFNRGSGATKQQQKTVVNTVPTNNSNRGSAGTIPRSNGNRRGAPRGGMLRGAGRGRGKLWVP